MSELFGFEAYSPKEIALKVENIGVAKARLPLLPMFLLGILAGAFIGLGALCFVLVKSDLALSFAVSQLLGGLVFSLGLILVVVAGAELFTGNNLLAIAWVDNKISSRELLKNWLVVCVANFVGAVGLAFLVFFSGHTDMNNGEIAQQYLTIAAINRAISPNSKRSMWEWFSQTILLKRLPHASQTALSSQRFWDHMDRIDGDKPLVIWETILKGVVKVEKIDLSSVSSWAGERGAHSALRHSNRRRGRGQRGAMMLHCLLSAPFCLRGGWGRGRSSSVGSGFASRGV